MITSKPERWHISIDTYGDEWWFGGEGHGQIVVNGWVSGGCMDNQEAWIDLLGEASVIAAAPISIRANQMLVGAINQILQLHGVSVDAADDEIAAALPSYDVAAAYFLAREALAVGVAS